MNTRKDNNGRALKAWKKLKPGLIEKPLRFIGQQTNAWKLEKGERVLVMSEQYKAALSQSKAGNGLFVQQMARSLA